MRSLILITMLILSMVPYQASALTRYSQQLCKTEGYTCLKVLKGQTWQSLFPDEQTRALIMRINRMNVPLINGIEIAIPNQTKDLNYLDFAPFEKQITAMGNKAVIVDPVHFAWGAYDETGKLINWGPASGGKNWCPDTQESCRTVIGEFKVYAEGGNGCKSGKYPLPNGGAPMPYCMFFKGGYAIHASTDVPGHNASHGCVRVFYEDAKWLNETFVEKGTTVIVRPYAKAT